MLFYVLKFYIFMEGGSRMSFSGKSQDFNLFSYHLLIVLSINIMNNIKLHIHSNCNINIRIAIIIIIIINYLYYIFILWII